MPVYKIIQKIIFFFLNITFFSHITYVLRFMFPRHARIHNSVPGWWGRGVFRGKTWNLWYYIYITSCTVKIFSGVSYIRREKVYCQWNIWIKEWINSNITIKRTVTIFFLSAIRHIKDTSSSTITNPVYHTFLDLNFLAINCYQIKKYYINTL